VAGYGDGLSVLRHVLRAPWSALRYALRSVLS